MLPASNRGAGQNIGFPDPCLTPMPPAPPVPVPYPNFAMNMMASLFAFIVKVAFMPALNMASKIATTMGHEPGAAHPLYKGMGGYTMGNPVVFVEKMPAINLLCPTNGNNMNNPLGAVLVPSIVNVFYTYAQPSSGEMVKGAAVEGSASGAGDAGAAADKSLSLDALRALAAAVAPEAGEASANGSGLNDAAASPADPPEVAVRGRWLDAEVMLLHVARVPSQLSRLVFNEIERLREEAPRRPIAAMVIDLRGNRGGDAQAALGLADDFLDRGAVLAIRRDSSGDETPLSARHSNPYPWPLTLLIDGHTASAAELFASALQHHGRARLAGDEPSHGKGSAQQPQPAPLGLGSATPRYMTVACYLRPDGTPIEGVGLTPDLPLSALPSHPALLSARS